MEDKGDEIISLIVCPKCNLELRLVGIEPESEVRDLFTFECPKCGYVETRSASWHLLENGR